MENNIHDDSFEKFIRDSVNRFDDEPSSDMWSRIKPVIPPKPVTIPFWKRYWQPTFLVLGCLLIGSIGVLLYHQQVESKHLKKVLDKTSNQLEVLTDKVESLEQKKVETAVNITQEKTANLTTHSIKKIESDIVINNKFDSKLKKGKPYNRTSSKPTYQQKRIIKTNAIFDKKLKTIQFLNPTDSVKILNKTDNSNTAIPIAQQTTTDETRINKSALFKKPKNQTTIGFLTNLNMKLPTSNQMLNFSKPRDIITVPPKNSQFSVGIYTQPIWVKNDIKLINSSLNTPPFPFNHRNERSKIGQGLGLELGYALNDKWTIYSGVAFNQSINRFNLNNTIQYSTQTEEAVNTEFNKNTVEYTAKTPYGDVAGEIDLLRNNATTVTDDEAIAIQANATHKISAVQIPITAQYSLINNKRWRIGIKGGVSAYFLVNNDFKISDLNIERAGFETNQTRFNRLPRPNQSMAIQLQTGLSLGYKLSDDWMLTLEPTLSRNITNNHKGNFTRTRLSFASAQMGVEYAF